MEQDSLMTTASASQWTERVDRAQIVAIASDLIAIASPSGQEAAVMARVQDWCRERGLRFDVTALDPARPNVIVSAGQAGNGPTLVMNGHLDTVPVSDLAAWESGPFEPRLS